ncbi:ATP-binding protein [Archangium gephyra]|uniref:nSTAND1 domain-containing NTPase n=1 Tax=Archangium gephyra TaxID=48 RepID=UPI0035D52A60
MNSKRYTNPTANQKVLEEKIQEFEAEYPFGKALRKYLDRDKIEIVRVERGQQRRWHVFAFLPETMRSMFDIERELLILSTDYPRLEPRILSELQANLRDHARVDDEVAVLVSPDAKADRLARQRAGETAILALDAQALSNPDQPSFREALAHTLATVDHFNVTTPIREASAFFGRQRDITEVRQSLEQGQHLGIFGLRKAGKSSLLNRVQALLTERGWAVVALDLNEFFGTPRRFKTAIVKGFASEAERLGVTLPRLKITEDRRGADINESWLDDLEKIVFALSESAGLALIIDEIDSALPARTLSVTAPVEDTLGLLRALSQFRAFAQRLQMHGKNYPVLLGAGVDPALFEQPKIRDLANPLYQFSRLKFLAPLDREELAAMVRTLGKRTGMRFRAHELIDSLYNEYGGHPLLSRQACSFVHKHRPKDQVPYHVTSEDLERAFTARGPDTPLWHALDVPESFAEWFPQEANLLNEYIANTQNANLRSRLQHAIAYGLLNEDGTVRMQALRRGPRVTS